MSRHPGKIALKTMMSYSLVICAPIGPNGKTHEDARIKDVLDYVSEMEKSLSELLECQDGVPMTGPEATRRADEARALLNKS